MKVEWSERLRRLPPYLFADLRRKRAEAEARGVRVLNLGIGDPDLPTPDPVVAALTRAIADADDPDRHRYGCDVPVKTLPDTVAAFYQQRFGVALDPNAVCVTMGSKDAIVKLALGLINPGDVGLATEPGYTTYNIRISFAGGVTHWLPLTADNDFLPDFDAIPPDVRRQAKLLWLNYPNNPTTAVADLAFYERAVAFCREHDILLCSDLAYSENTYDGYVAPSVLQVPGAADVAIEFFSLSKAFNMTGWRVGFAVGQPDAVAALQTVKNNVDNGQLRPVQLAAEQALRQARQLTPPIMAVYQRRRDRLVETLNQVGWSLTPPRGTLYLWVPVPDGYEGDSIRFAGHLLDTAGVMVTPGVGFGPHGEGFFRISLTYPDEVIEAAMTRLAAAL